jgi:hypothetical protein
MNELERKLCHQLVMMPDGRVGIGQEEFVRQFPSAVREGRLSLELVHEAVRSENSDDLMCTMVIGHVFSFGPEHVDLLYGLVDSVWHQSHEDVVSALDDLRTPDAIGALFRATQW